MNKDCHRLTLRDFRVKWRSSYRHSNARRHLETPDETQNCASQLNNSSHPGYVTVSRAAQGPQETVVDSSVVSTNASGAEH